MKLHKNLKIKKWDAVSIGFGAGLLLVLFAVIVPLASGIIEALGTAGRYRERLALVGADRDKREELLDERRQLDSLYASLNLHVSRERRFSGILTGMNGFAGTSGVELISVHPQSKENHGWFERQPVELHLRGTYHGIARFVNEIENMEHIVAVGRLAMNAGNMLSNTVNASITVHVYLGT